MGGVVGWRSLVVAVVATASCACTLTGGGDQTSPPIEPTTTDPTPEAITGGSGVGAGVGEDGADDTASPRGADPNGDLFALLGADDQIVVQTRQGELSILTFGGQTPVDGGANASQPVFSGDGSRLVWTAPDPRSAAGTVVIADVDDDGSTAVIATISTPLVSFYNAWAPGSRDRLAVLGNTRSGVGLAVVDVTEATAELADVGTPYYFVWDPDGTGLIGHVAASLRTFDLEARTGLDLFDVNPSFRTPAVLSDRSTAFVAADNLLPFAGRNALVRLDAGPDGLVGASATGVARFEGTGTFTLSPDEQILAVVVEGSLETAPIFSASTHAAGFQADDGLDRGLHLIDLETGQIRQVVDAPVRAAFWSPNGEFVLSLGFAGRADGITWVIWQVHDRQGRPVTQTDPFAVSREFGTSYLPFYDQYAQSTQLWSPDGTRFVFPGMSEDGDTGIWIHQLPSGDAGPRTAKVADGVIAFWSPG